MDFTYLLRPKTFDDLVGQEHLSAADAPLRVLAEKGVLGHSFLYGPAGCGKTSLARIVANVMELPFYELNATSLKIEELRKIFSQYKNALQKPLIFIDEVHRLSKNQQEVLLPFMERNEALIIGASTENPFFSLTSAIRSRSILFELHSVSNNALRVLAEKVCKHAEIKLEDEAKEYLIKTSGGDARAMLKLLEFSTNINTFVTLDILKSLRPNALQAGSSEAGVHYDLASALIKSIRGSDADAAVYYLARLIDGGEPAEFIARRLAILASEDIGNANPPALNLASSTLNIVKHIGYPEARISLSQLVIYLASSPKSNSAYLAINSAIKAIKEGEIHPIPSHIKTHAKTYQYPHNFGGWVEQSYLIKPLSFYQTQQIGFEKTLFQWHEKIKNQKD